MNKMEALGGQLRVSLMDSRIYRGANSEFLYQNCAVIPDCYPDLVSAGKRKIVQQSLGHVNDPLASSSNVKTSGASLFHSCEMGRKGIIGVNFIRNHKINIDSNSYTFTRKVMKWRTT